MKWLLIILLISSAASAQIKINSLTSKKDITLKNPAAGMTDTNSVIKGIFKKIESGLKTNSINDFKDEFGDIVSMTIGSDEHGYYSANQAVSVLVNYFSERKLSSFEFSVISEKDNIPYATGRFTCIQKGIKKNAQVYVSLIRQDSSWVISQFNIY